MKKGIKKRKKRVVMRRIAAGFFSSVLAFSLLLDGGLLTAYAADYEAVVTCSEGTVYYEAVEDAFTYANNQDTATIILQKSCEAESALTVSGSSVTLDLAGYTLTIKPAGLTVNGGMTLNDSSEEATGMLTNANTKGNANGGAVVIGGAGTLTMNGGTISGSYAGTLGAGIYVNGGVLKMNGGAVKNNEAGMYGGGVYVINGDFEMNGGEISGNVSYSYGAGVYLSASTFTMTGGTINDNSLGSTTSSNGGGIYATSSSTLEISDGEISGNEAAYAGSGIFLSSSSLTMSGGAIKNNCVLSGGNGNYGIGLYLTGSPSTFTMSGGEITGNTSTNSATQGAGVYASANVSTTLSGKVVISGNTANGAASNYYMVSTNKRITLADGLAEGASVGVTTSTTPTTSAPVQITTAESGTSYYALAKTYFSSDGGYEIHENTDGYLELYITPSTYTVTWNLTNLSTTGAASATDSAAYTAMLSSAADGYEVPEEITVTVGGEELSSSDYSYDVATGEFSLAADKIAGDIVITASAAAVPEAPTRDASGKYQLYTESDVLWLQGRILRGIQVDAIVMADITMSDTFTGIGTSSSPFSGTLDGNEHTITLAISSDDAAGLFAYADGATIKNLTTAGSVTTDVNTGTGAIVGSVGTNGITLENCVNQASVTGKQKTGGLVGTTASTGKAVITGCSNGGTVTGTSSYTGGIIGWAVAAYISQTTNSASVSGVGYVGGILGYASTTTANAQGLAVSDCLNEGAVTGTGYAGGIIGWAKGISESYMVTLSRCGNEGDISVTTSTGYAGGIVGYFNSKYISGESLYNAGTVSGSKYLGGIVGRNSGAPLTDVYNVGAVTSNNTSTSYTGGIIGYCGTAVTVLTNAYNAGAVTAGTGATSVGLIAGFGTANYYVLADNVYYLNTLELPDTNKNGDVYLYSSDTGAALTDDEKAAMAKSSDDLTALASTLGDSFKDNGNTEYHSGYPVLTWETVPVYVASVSDGETQTKYETVEAAFEAANELAAAAVITLLADCEISEELTVESGADISLDLAGYILCAAEDAESISILTVEGTLILADSSEEGTGTVSGGSWQYGAGVHVSTGGSFTMNGGTISGNAASGTYGGYGGGVYVEGSFTMNGGSISNNMSATYGGGVYMAGGNFTINGGSVSNNTSVTNGGGVYADANSTMTLSGTAVITGNTVDSAANNFYMADAQNSITLGDALADGAAIGVTVSTELALGASVQLTATETESSFYASAAQYFSSDQGYDVIADEGGYLKIYNTPDSYSVIWNLTNLTTTGMDTASNDKDYTATLTAAGGYELPESITVTVAGEELASTDYTYDTAAGSFSLAAEKVTGVIVVTASATAVPETYELNTDGLTNITLSTEAVPTEDEDFTAILAADEDYVLPDSITVTVGGEALTADTDYCYDAETGALTIYAAVVTGDITITAAAEEETAASNYILGDVNGDGTVTVFDTTWLKRYIANAEIMIELDLLAADINGDGTVNSLDVTFLSRYIAGMEDTYGIGTEVTAQ